MSVAYLSVEQVVLLHKVAIVEFGGRDGIRSEDALFSSVLQPQQSAFGEDAYPTIPEKAAAYGFFIAENQAFIDGNKRTAAAAMLVFLYANGYTIRGTDDEIADVFLQLGSGGLDRDGFFEWIRQHAEPVDGEDEI